MRARVASAGLVLVVSAMAVSCQDQAAQTSDAEATVQAPSVTTVLSEASDLAISSRLINSAGLGQALDGAGSYTIFVPIDEAWSALQSAEIESLESNEGRPQLVAVLRQHIASGSVLVADMDDAFARSDGSLSLATLGAGPITLRRDEQTVFIGEEDGGPRIVGAAIPAGNDVIYRIDQLIPAPE